jgi:alkylation response protein AidB-like acyl-CoA dehydrogenase
VDFSISDEQRLLLDSTRQLLARDSPIGRVRELAGRPGGGYDTRVWQRGSELGWAALLVPEDCDGLGRDLVDVALIAEEHGRTVQPGPLISNAVATVGLTRSRRDDVRSRVLPALATGAAVVTWAFAEPHQPWDAAAVSVVATADGDGFRLRGIKTAVADADTATWILVTARLDGRLAQFLVDRHAAGLVVRRQRTIDITRGFDEVRLEDVRVASSALLEAGDEANTTVALQNRCGAVLVSADSLGVGERVLQMTVEYARLRVQFGRPIGSFQAVKHKCATMRMWLQASKAYTSTAIPALTSEALQVHGGIGFTWEHDLHLYHRRAKANEVLFGDPYLHHERLAAELVSAGT